MKQADGTVLYLAHRNIWVGYFNGKIQCSRKTESACKEFLKAKFGVVSSDPMPKDDLVVSTAPKKALDLKATQDTLIKQVADEWAKAKELFPTIKDMDTPKVKFFTRGTYAGKAYRVSKVVAFNTILAAENPNEFINTVKHELAHIIVYVTYPQARDHGAEFRYILIKMGGDGKRLHNYDVSSVKRKSIRYEYKCSCMSYSMSAIRHNRAIRGVKYACRICREKIVYTGKKMVA
jgi:SprT protein